MVHRRLLEHERYAPHNGGEDEQEIGVKAGHAWRG
jgi:hypothetical protein